MLGLDNNIVELVPYDKEWAEEYQKEKKILKSLLGELALDIQHVGSTAIPGISAKPIIDIAVAIKTEDDFYKIRPILEKEGYDLLDSIKEKGELLARKGAPENRTHYIHIEVQGNEYWENHILFRDYLLAHPECILKYEEVKNKAYGLYKDDRKKYTAEKASFIKEIINKAKKER